MRKQFKKVKDLLVNDRRWTKGQEYTINGRYCLMAAIERCYNWNKHVKVHDKVLSYIVKYYPQYNSIENFNDTDTTTFKNVRRIIEKTNI